MTTGGDAVLAVARGEIGYVEGPNNSTKYWDWYGSNLGSWCAVFVSWCTHMAGVPICEIDSGKGFVLVSNGTWHSYTEGMVSATNLEAQRTADLQPGDVVLYSWEPWEFVGGVPTCSGGEWAGWTAGDHTGIVNTAPDGSGYFTAVEGNTSDGSADNGGMVLERTRHISQVCGWWRFPNINTGGGPRPEEEDLTPEQDQMLREIYNMCTWINTNTGENHTILVSNDIAAVNYIRDIFNLSNWTNTTAQNTEAVARATFDNTVAILGGNAPPPPSPAPAPEAIETSDK